MSFSFYKVDKRPARMHRFFITFFVFFCFTPGIHATCYKETENAHYLAKRISNEWPLRPSYDKKSQYIQKLAAKIIISISLSHKPNSYDWPTNSWQFTLLRDSSVNAYSIGDGKIYITDGTLNFVKNEAELAAILAHEIAHQLIGHFCQADKLHTSHAIGSFLQFFNNDIEKAADALAVKILQKAHFPAHAMLTVLKRSPSINNPKSNQQKRQRISALIYQLKTIKKNCFLFISTI